jgi:hypothetical protein
VGDLLLIAGLVFFVDLLFVFFSLFGFLLTLVLLAFVSHSFLLRFFDFSFLLIGRILKRLLNWSPSDEFRAHRIFYPLPWRSAAQNIPGIPKDIFGDLGQISENILAAVYHKRSADGSLKFSAFLCTQDRPRICEVDPVFLDTGLGDNT